jgi:hypothetical protein
MLLRETATLNFSPLVELLLKKTYVRQHLLIESENLLKKAKSDCSIPNTLLQSLLAFTLRW